MNKNDLKRFEAICKMAEHKMISGLYITYGLQSLIYKTTNPHKLDASIISASYYPYLTVERSDGSKITQPISLGN